ncbi:uncharacterized protein [Ptychodera flava]|uniref:uncharacterized protein n=1 Tax=Ptychodera flava TaxID=63121 RepID=UPI003969CEAB
MDQNVSYILYFIFFMAISVAKGENCTEPNSCEQICQIGLSGEDVCSCLEGYIPVGNGTQCQDMDECEAGNDTTVCHHHCNNTPGSFYCACFDGYRLQSDSATCRPVCAVNEYPCSDVFAYRIDGYVITGGTVQTTRAKLCVEFVVNSNLLAEICLVYLIPGCVTMNTTVQPEKTKDYVKYSFVLKITTTATMTIVYPCIGNVTVRWIVSMVMTRMVAKMIFVLQMVTYVTMKPAFLMRGAVIVSTTVN